MHSSENLFSQLSCSFSQCRAHNPVNTMFNHTQQIKEPRITLQELAPLYLYHVIDLHAVNSQIVAVTSNFKNDEDYLAAKMNSNAPETFRQSKIFMYNRFRGVWNCCCANDQYVPPAVKRSFLDKRRGNLYLFGLTIVMCYDMATKHTHLHDLTSRIFGYHGSGRYAKYSESDIQMICKGDEVHILLISDCVATDYIVWNFVKKKGVFSMTIDMLMPRGCRLLFAKSSDTPHIFTRSSIYEVQFRKSWDKLYFGLFDDTGMLTFRRFNLNPTRTIVTDCGRYVINVGTREVVIFDMESEELRTQTIGTFGERCDQALYFHDDAEFLTAAFIRYYYYRNSSNNNSNIGAGFPSYLIDYIAKWGAQEWIYICR